MFRDKGRIGTFGVLTLIFIVLKLVGVIALPWWAVLLPSILPLAIMLCIYAIIGIVLTHEAIKNARR